MRAAERFDVAVIGSGPGGAVAAYVLAEAGRRVAILEEGPALAQDSCRAFSLEEMRQKYRNGGVTASFGGGKIAYVEGRVVGGGSEINSGLYHRAPAEALEQWRREAGLAGASEADMRAHFEACEKDLGVGPSQETPSPAESRFIAGSAAIGAAAVRARRIGDYVPSPSGPRWSRKPMSKTYLPRALAAGAALIPGARALSLSRSGGRWRIKTDGAREVEADAVFLACGAIQTPALLRRSGVRGRVGDGLALHPMLKVVAEFDGRIQEGDFTVAAAQVKDAARGLALGCSIGSPSNLALALAERDLAAASRWPTMGSFYCSAGAFSRGSVRPLPGFRDPLVRYRLAPEDLDVLSRGLRALTEILLAQGARVLSPSIAGAGPVRSLADLPDLSEDRLRLTSVHLMASCRMGGSESAPLDSFGRVRGADGLYVCDASVFCGPIGVNPQGTIMALSRRNALACLGKL